MGLSIITIILCPLLPYAQVKAGDILIDDQGIMHFREDGTEVTGFGVNYTVPFAHAFRSGKKLNVDLRKAIDQDVYHFRRLGFDLFRVHVWDCEISDTLGHLLDNEHLELFDYLLYRLQQNGIRAVITPIAYWGNGWPDPDEPTPGFSHKYGKDSCLIDPNAIKAQETYLAAFVNHINRYTGIPFKTDPFILAFEISNEPHHRGTPKEVTSFVRRMKEAIRSTGCAKPVFYNVSHSIHLAPAYYAAGIDGGTFQWYPTGLGFQKELGGNLLPNVDRYTIPFDDLLKKEGSARIVYEFDAADMASTCMYPAMARSFRSAGIQLATHFSYDPTFLAPYNTEYNTHYMNLLYAPRKALALMICGEVFRQIPLYKDYGAYPGNTTFGPFHISYENDLAEMVTDEKFIHTHHTSTTPPSPEKLQLIAGWGNSPLVQYAGKGAYFLDRISEHAWRLEVMPDVTQVRNLFGRNNLQQKVAVLHQDRHTMTFRLPGLNQSFTISAMDTSQTDFPKMISDGKTEILPGIYLLTGAQITDTKSLPKKISSGIGMNDLSGLPAGSIEPANRYFASRPPRAQSNGSLVLFDAAADTEWLNRQWVPGSGLQTNDQTGNTYYAFHLKGLSEKDPENPEGKPIGDYSMRHYFGDLLQGMNDPWAGKKEIIVHASCAPDETYPLQIALVLKDGSAFGASVQLNAGQTIYHIPLKSFKKVPAVLLPRPYPTFVPYYSIAGASKQLQLNEAESLQISIGPGIPEKDWGKDYHLKLEKVLAE